MNIAIIEDNTKFRECLALGLSSFADCQVVHQLGNALHIEKKFTECEPDLALVDIHMPGIGGDLAVGEISRMFPKVQCIMLTVNADMEMILKCLLNGAKGYLLKDKDSIQNIVASLRTLHSGNYNAEFPLNGTLAHKILHYISSQQTNLNEKLDRFQLTGRQKEILLMLYQGKSYKQIASDCNISTETLNTHVKAIYPKLQINSRSELKMVLG